MPNPRPSTPSSAPVGNRRKARSKKRKHSDDSPQGPKKKKHKKNTDKRDWSPKSLAKKREFNSSYRYLSIQKAGKKKNLYFFLAPRDLNDKSDKNYKKHMKDHTMLEQILYSLGCLRSVPAELKPKAIKNATNGFSQLKALNWSYIDDGLKQLCKDYNKTVKKIPSKFRQIEYSRIKKVNDEDFRKEYHALLRKMEKKHGPFHEKFKYPPNYQRENDNDESVDLDVVDGSDKENEATQSKQDVDGDDGGEQDDDDYDLLRKKGVNEGIGKKGVNEGIGKKSISDEVDSDSDLDSSENDDLFKMAGIRTDGNSDNTNNSNTNNSDNYNTNNSDNNNVWEKSRKKCQKMDKGRGRKICRGFGESSKWLCFCFG